MVFFAYMASGPFAADVMVHKVSADGVLRESVLIPTPYSAMVHDFVITDGHVLIPVMPLTGSLDRAMAGGPPFAWEAEKGGFLGVLPRRAGATAADVRWFPMDPPFAFHFMNAFEDGSVFTIDACQFEHAPLFPTPDGKSTGRAKPILSRWRLDLNEAEPRVRFAHLDGIEAEFPQCDPRVVGQRYRHGWFTSPDGGLKSALVENENMYNTIGHYDHATGAEQRFSCGMASVSEAIFVPRAADAPEGEGYLLTVATSFETRTSSLYVFDAQRVADGPLAKAHLSHYVPAGFHGGWRAASGR
jgi:carotenoid cleavage dioxygenase